MQTAVEELSCGGKNLIMHMNGEISFQQQQPPLSAFSHLPGLRGTEMWGGGFSAGYELFGQIFISGGHQENKTAAAWSYMHVSSIQDEGDCALNGGETLYLHGQLGPSRRAAGNWVLQTWKLHNTYSTWAAHTGEHMTRIQGLHFICSVSVTIVGKYRFYWNVIYRFFGWNLKSRHVALVQQCLNGCLWLSHGDWKASLISWMVSVTAKKTLIHNDT